jgi:rhodanese-related sulfurtransferase
VQHACLIRLSKIPDRAEQKGESRFVGGQEAMPVNNVTVQEAHEKLTSGYMYIDVRSVPEYEQGHPAGAFNVPLLHRDARTGQMAPNADFLHVIRANFTPETKLLIGCQVGGRSAQAAHVLAASGYKDVSNVLGGYAGTRDPATGHMRAEGWVHAGLPVERETPDRSYEQLHRQAHAGDR